MLATKKLDEKRVRKEVREAFKILAEAFKVKIGKKDYPDVYIGVKYKIKNRSITFPDKIYINPMDVGCGPKYFHEASHFLRYLVQKRKGRDYVNDDDQVHEFYARVGEFAGRDLTKGTDLAYLFEGKQNQPVDMNNPKIKQRIIYNLNRLRKLKKRLRIRDEKRWQKRVRLSRELHELREQPEENREKLREVGSALDNNDPFYFDRERTIERYTKDYFIHKLPTVYGQQYSIDGLKKINNFYGLTDKTVRRKFFRKSNSLLEKTVQVALLILSPIFLFYLIYNIRLTGSFLGNPSYTITGGIILFLLIIFLLYLKIK